MEEVASVINAIAAVVWPLVLAVFAWKLLPILRSRLSSGDVNVKMFGIEVSLQDASENFGKQLADLQDKVAELRALADKELPGKLESVSHESVAPPAEAILWVDDNPGNNYFEIARLRSAGVSVVQVTSTEAALAALAHHRFAKVVTDMERTENGRTEPQAGLLLIRRLKEAGLAVPVYVYCSPGAVDIFGSRLLAEGAAAVTSSPVELLERLDFLTPHDQARDADLDLREEEAPLAPRTQAP